MALLDCLFRSEVWQVSCVGLQDPPGGSCLSVGGVTVAMDSSGHKASGNACRTHTGPHTPSHSHPLVDPSLFSPVAPSARRLLRSLISTCSRLAITPALHRVPARTCQLRPRAVPGRDPHTQHRHRRTCTRHLRQADCSALSPRDALLTLPPLLVLSHPLSPSHPLTWQTLPGLTQLPAWLQQSASACHTHAPACPAHVPLAPACPARPDLASHELLASRVSAQVPAAWVRGWIGGQRHGSWCVRNGRQCEGAAIDG